jgi:hypothetical protein
VDDLVVFLRARLDEETAAARAAADFGGGIIGPGWRVSGTHTDEGGTYWSITATAVASGHEQVVEVVGSGMSGGGAHTEQVARHAARHDPARVLREVEAKRRLVERYERAVKVGGSSASGYVRGQDSGYIEACLDAIGEAVAIYADHPDYREEWRP